MTTYSDGILTMVNTPVDTKEKPMTLTREIVGEDLVLVSQELHFNYIKKQYFSDLHGFLSTIQILIGLRLCV
jgi:hypothetical protein